MLRGSYDQLDVFYCVRGPLRVFNVVLTNRVVSAVLCPSGLGDSGASSEKGERNGDR